jgi:integrase
VLLDESDLRGVTKSREKMTFAEVTQNWLNVRGHRHAPATAKRRDQILRLHVLPHLGHMPIRAIRLSHIREIVASWEREQMTAATIRTHMNYMRPVFKLAIQDDIISKDPTTGLQLPPLRHGKGTILDKEQCRTLLAAAPDNYWRAFHILLATGLRIGEFMDLTVGDVDLQKRILVVKGSKTETGEREIHLSENDVEVLRQQIASIGQESRQPDAILFRSTEGKKLVYRNFAQRVLKKIIKTTGLPAFTFHDLRKTHATMLVEAGYDPKVIQQRMGHANIETTLKFYAQPTKDRLQAAADVATTYLATGL